MKDGTKSILLSLLVMALWGSLFPFIKLGYKVFSISSTAVPDILMFAGMRFVVSGAAVCIYCLIRRKRPAKPRGKNIFSIFIMGIFSIVLHYGFTYVGLGVTDSSKTALLKQLGVLIYVCFAFLFLKEEHFSPYKIMGAIVGFCGIIAIDYSASGFVLKVGDLLIIMASVCTVIANIIGKAASKNNSPFLITGISQFTGGVILLAASLIMGGKMLRFNLTSTLVFTYICVASVAGYTLWYYVLKHTSLSKLFIIKFAEPLFACLFSAAILGENVFRLQYLAAFVLISLGIVLGHKGEEAKKQ